MEGLIPMVFKAIKRTKTRRHYECLSSDSSVNYNVADSYYINEEDTRFKPAIEKHSNTERKTHRRYASVDDMPAGGFSVADHPAAAASSHPKQLVRFRSHRMFSCVSGA
ncbi:hypothetical protein Tsubulata_001263 [Turnera subulata]|uniref:Uncharacterized protein n=1 Tax=Turnera subulata TaxID=218843 RepID=A0A9Q0J8R1_9ROSI|nr:hypothetical protein Tsubulata_001263 [Turnera subulata]